MSLSRLGPLSFATTQASGWVPASAGTTKCVGWAKARMRRAHHLSTLRPRRWARGACHRAALLRGPVGFAHPTILPYLNVIASPERSAFAISPTWRPASSSTAPFWLVSTIARAPPPTASPAPAAP
jgi:hypothetical protein